MLFVFPTSEKRTISTPRLTLYHREACHLCDDMWQHLLEIQAGRNFELVRLDVDADSELQRQFGALVPVLTGGEQIICNYYLDPVALERYLSEIV